MNNIEWIKDVIFILPVAGLIWKAAMQSAQIKQNTKDIESIRKDSETNQQKILTALNNMNSIMQQLKLDVEVIKALRKQEVENEK